MAMNTAIGDLLRLKRLEKKYTLGKTAELVGVSHNYISKLEKGENSNPSDEVIVKLASALEIDEDSLFTMFGKVPLSTRETLEKNPVFAKAFSEIDNDKQLSEEKQLELKDIFIKWYEKLSKE
ncbi:helix-turn-helix transcriptional regulator [Priestia megaterium]|uniref:helix-turn-helix domain-containing protein n=1 Tax=Priestia megaterium TaxID=1404 RepID=UPI002E1B3560|nr:helix-turn-helix transcriptional regulator [Priestia megaterium]